MPCPGRTCTLETTTLFLSRSCVGCGDCCPLPPGGLQDLNKMKYEILIYSAGVSSFQLHVLLSLPGCGCRECSEMWPQLRAFPGLLGSAVEGRGRRSIRETDRRMDRSCHLFFFVVAVLFYFLFTDFCRKTKAKNSFL